MFRRLALTVENLSFSAASLLGKIGACLLLVLMMVTVVDIVYRFFGKGLLGAMEIVQYAMVVLIFFSMAYIQACKKNIVVKVIYERFSITWKRIFDALFSIVCLVLYSFFTYAATLQTITIFKSGQVSATLLIPKYPFIAAMAIGFFFLSLVLLGDLLVSLSALINGGKSSEKPIPLKVEK